MTLREALTKRIPRIRQENWALEDDYLLLPLQPNGLHGPWARLFSRVQYEVLGEEAGAQQLFICDSYDQDGYVEYTSDFRHPNDKE